ncbi:MAG: phosphate signaling complex protein PhoU [Lachnospiraceae bacterium]|nr:phosphate signaling complex protein PhoU [Lachnospiraceae bacterium]
MAPRIVFQQELEQLRQDVLQMAEWVEDGYDCLFDALKKNDLETMKKFVRHDRTLEDMQRNIESKCLSLLTRQTPVARDLRTVSAALKVVTDLERCGNHLSDMAELFVRMSMRELSSFSEAFLPMVTATGEILKQAADAFLNRDAALGEAVIKGDDVIDDYFNLIKVDLVEALKTGSLDADHCVDALMIAKYLEKIGDHAVNIGQWEIFQETGYIDEIRLL